jgi:SAM-dependent methyltransferase
VAPASAILCAMDERDHQAGLHGLALLRAGARGDDRAVAAHRDALRALLEASPSGRSRRLPALSVADGYAEWARSYDGRRNPTIVAEEPAVRRLLLDRPPGDAVDVACGTGRHSGWLVERGHRVTAVDSSPEMLAVAARTVPEARTILADVRDLPLADGCADVVVCALALSHLPDLAPVAELARLLRPGGRLVVSNVHPFATAVLGERAWTATADGGRARIPEHPHPLGAYVHAFRAAGLVPTALLEPSHDDDEPLLAGEPAAVVWAADRPDLPSG